MKLIRIKSHDAVEGTVTYESTSGAMPEVVQFKRKQPEIINVMIPTEEFYLDAGSHAQKITPGEHVLVVDLKGRISVMLQQKLDREYTAVEPTA